MRLFIVETADGEWNIWRATPLKEGLRIAPKIRDGHVTLGRAIYVVDPSRRRTIERRGFIRRWRITFDYVYMWKENDPEQQDFFGRHERKDDIAGDIMAQLAKSHKVRNILPQETNWVVILLLFSVISNIVLGIALWQASQGAHP